MSTFVAITDLLQFFLDGLDDMNGMYENMTQS